MDGIGDNPSGEVHAQSMIESSIVDRRQDLENWRASAQPQQRRGLELNLLG
jgi:hypothetical protein